jgi:lysophospholipase L1-like esterase
MRSLWLWIPVLFLGIPLFGQGIRIEPPVKMLALGDSYTIGASVAVDERWPHQLMAALNDMGFESETPDYIAVTGWTTQALLGGIERQLDTTASYNLVSILIGVNNQYQGIPIDSYEPDLREIIEIALKAAGNDTGSVFMVSIPDYAYTPFGNGDTYITAGINAYNDINYRVAMEYGLTYVNITSISRRGLGEPNLVASDGLHPSGDQYALWVEAIMSWILPGSTVGVNPEQREKKGSFDLAVHPDASLKSLRVWADPPADLVRVHDLNGRVLLEQKGTGPVFELDLSGFGRGLYILQGFYASDRRAVPFMVN